MTDIPKKPENLNGSVDGKEPKILNTADDDIGKAMDYQGFMNIWSILCPFPTHGWYTKLRNRLSPEQKKFLREHVCITDDGKVEIIQMGEKYSLLHRDGTGIVRNTWVDGIDKFRQGYTIQWDYKDSKGETGINWLSYSNAEAVAETTLTPNNHTRCLSGERKFRRLLNNMPWDTDEDKIRSLVDLLELPYTGTYNETEGVWIQVGIVWYLRVSGVNTGDASWRSAVRIYFSDKEVGIDNNYSGVNSYIPTLVYERTKGYNDPEITGDDFKYLG